MGFLLQYFSQDVVNVLRAVLLLLLAYIIAGITKGIVLKLIGRTKLMDLLDKADKSGNHEKGSSLKYIGKLIYLLVFLLFVPGIFALLGVSQVADPIVKVLSQVWGYVPNIIAAVIVILVGNLIAKLIRQLVQPLFEKLGVNRLQEKAGIEPGEDGKLSVTLSYIVYVLIFIPVIVVALQVLSIDAIASPATNMLYTIFAFIPNIAVAVLIMLLGGMLGKLAANILRQIISASGIDQKLQKLLGEKGRGLVLSKLVSETAKVVIIIFFIVEGINMLHLSVMTHAGQTLIEYMPNVLAALLILLAAVVGADAAENALKKSGLYGFAMITRITIMTVGVFMILSQLGIAESIVTKAFLIIVAALAIAFGVAFGVGGREFAKKQLDRLDKKLEQTRSEGDAGQDA